ncbi:hypothetical protein JG688_00005760 [Phytophthora aleatoria]|uniref:EF-hand domain-containing protein n=1 Tax=Phytophthora aleatoria TaxID=2496075 RepID=A0A8J5J1R4_9STRA|nr:hypothetical protein JG688_00005760 [Phytophthora aleatoria]
MGQLQGKATYLKCTTSFLNASERDVNKLWESFNDVAEGFGLSQDELVEICRSMQQTLEIHARSEMDQLSAALFAALDTDEVMENGLVDALEFLGTMAMMSAMPIPQKVTFVYNCYDFNETGQLSLDELTLAFKSTLTGLCKLCVGLSCPTELVLEDLAQHAFQKAQKPGVDVFLSLPEFLRFADTTPEVTSWVDYFDCPLETVDEQDGDDSDAEREAIADLLASSALDDDDTARKRDASLPQDAAAPDFTVDKMIPRHPWQLAVANATPSAPPTIDPRMPAASLELEWVYGYNSDLRNIVHYVSPAEAVYPAGSVVVVYDTVAHRQRFACHHSGLVQTLAVHPSDRRVIATGEAALIPKIVIWSTQTLSESGAGGAAVTTLFAFTGGVLSGGKDGKVRIWSRHLEPGAQFDLVALGSSSPRVRSLVASPDGGAKLLIATAGAEIFEIASSDGANLHFGPVVCGHSAFQLHGLAIHPLRRECCSAGDDRTVRVWDLSAHRQLRISALDAPARACAYSPDGSTIAVGQGAEEEDEDNPTTTDPDLLTWRRRQQPKLVNPNKQGAFAVLNESSLAVKFEAKDSKRPIRTLRFSGDGLTLAVGSSDNCIYSYHTEDWASKGKCRARDAGVVINTFDFSTTGEHIMANARNRGEMVFFDSSSGVEITRVATLKDVEWLSCSCPYGWGVQGAWPARKIEACEISAVDRSSGVETPMLVAGDTLGSLRLFRYPCVKPESLCQVARGAASTISAVQFTADGSHVVASARDERCIFQWRIEREEMDVDGGNGDADDVPGTSDDEREVSHGDKRSAFDEAAAVGDFALELLAERLQDPTYNQEEQEETGGDLPKATTPAVLAPSKPWVSSSVPPSEAPNEGDLELSTVPSDSLELEWVYGYRCHDVRNNLFLTRAKSLMVYPAANIVVLLDTKLWLQRHFKQHTDEVTSLTTYFGPSSKVSNASQEIAASGQMGRFPVIHVWRIDSLEVLVSLRGFHRHGIAELRFNSAGNLLASVGLDDRNSLALYDWRSGELLAHANFIAVGLGSGGTGRRHKKDGSMLVFEDRGQSVELVYETRDTKQSVTALRFSPDGQSLVCGALDGSVYIYDVPSNYTKRAVFSKHKAPITHVDLASDSQYLRSNCKGFELFFADVTTGSHVASATALRNHIWDTCSTIYNWSNQGVWPVAPTGLDAMREITCCACSLPGAPYKDSNAILAAGNSHGAISVLKYPSFVQGAGAKTYYGHSGAVAQLGFSGAGGALCVSIVNGNASIAKDPEEDPDLEAEGRFLPEAFVNDGGGTQSDVTPFVRSVYAIHATTLGCATGGRDGHVKLWARTTLTPLADFDIAAEDRLLIGTKGAELFELSRLTGDAILVSESHYDRSVQLQGLTVHPLRPELVVTAGGDHTVRLWHLEKRCVIAKTALDGALQSVAYSPDGKWLVVGFGGSESSKNHKDGAFAVLEGQTLELLHEGRDSKLSALDLTFSPDLTLLALASADHCVYFYSTLDNFSLRFKFSKPSGRATRLDFAADSSMARVSSDAFELLFVSTMDGSQITSAASAADVTWASHRCLFAWAAQGVWDIAGKPDDHVHALAKANTQEMLVAATNQGEIRVYNTPCLSRHTEQHKLHGHSLNVANVAFTCDDSRLVSIGANDKSLFVWKVKKMKL